MNEGHRERRTSYDLFVDIIEAALKPARVSDIVFSTRLNFTVAHKYLDQLIELGLIRRISETAAYEATEKGLEYLEAFRLVQKILVSKGME